MLFKLFLTVAFSSSLQMGHVDLHGPIWFSRQPPEPVKWSNRLILPLLFEVKVQ